MVPGVFQSCTTTSVSTLDSAIGARQWVKRVLESQSVAITCFDLEIMNATSYLMIVFSHMVT